jgi:oligopeptide/dipeptide ABC transporter ATP-binding protein
MAGAMSQEENLILDVQGLRIDFRAGDRTLNAVDGVSFCIAEGETHAIVGESGCGKSVSSMAMLDLLPRQSSKVTADKMELRTKSGRVTNLLLLNAKEQRAVRGDEIAMIFQEPMTSLNPMHSVGDQIAEAVILHRDVSRAQARAEAIDMMKRVGIGEAESRSRLLPHEMSGGMRQRIMIAMALVCRPKLLIADEPTTALDVTIQAQILDLIRRLKKEFGMAVLFITHDLAVVAEIADKVTVMYAGQVVETGTVRDVLTRPQHPYTQALLRSLPEAPGSKKSEKLHTIPGTVPDLASIPQGCRFHPRCGEFVPGLCDTQRVAQVRISGTHMARCVRLMEKVEVSHA